MKHRHPILVSLAVAHDDFAPAEVDVLHAKPHRFHDAKTCAVQQSPDEPMHAVEPRKNARHLVPGENNRDAQRRFRPFNVVEPREVCAQHLLVEEEQRALRLILRRWRDTPIDCERCQECLDLRRPQRRWMTLAMEEDEASNPVAISLLGPDAVMLETDALADAIEQQNRRNRPHGMAPFGPTP